MGCEGQGEENRWKLRRGIEETKSGTLARGGASGESGARKTAPGGRRTCARDRRRRQVGRGALTWTHVTGRGPTRLKTARPRPLPRGAPGPRGPERRRRREPGRRRRAEGGGGGARRRRAAAAACRPAERQSRRPRTPPCPSRRPGSLCPPARTSCGPTRVPSSAWRL